MKQFLKKIIILILGWEARLVLRKYKPKIVGVTGSVGKTGTKDAIALALSAKYRVRKSEKSYNSDMGVPLTILGEKSAWNNPLEWFAVILRGLELIITQNDYPEWLVLEIGAGRPNEIKDNVRGIKFDIAVLTSLPDIPVHVEMFGSRERLVEEKMYLLRAIGPDGTVVLCLDDSAVMAKKSELSGRLLTYGRGDGAQVRSRECQIEYVGAEEAKRPAGLTCQIEYQGKPIALHLENIVGYHQINPVLAAFACGQAAGVNTTEIVRALAGYKTPPGRLNLLLGRNGSTILDDTYNSSPIALEAALLTLSSLETSGRKIAVIGNMMELGSYTAAAHKKIGELSAGVCDLIITVGVRARFAYEAALAKGYSPERIKHFDNSAEAGDWLETKIGLGDIILVKGSQSARMEKVVEKIMAEPERKKELLVRQEEEWKER